MKKIVALFVVFSMMFTMLPALAESADTEAFLGVWYVSTMTTEEQAIDFAAFGIDIIVELKEDGTASQITRALGEEESFAGVWEVKDDAVAVSLGSNVYTASIQEEKLYLADGESVMELTRTKNEGEADDGMAALTAMSGDLSNGEGSEDEDISGLFALLGGLFGGEEGEGEDGTGFMAKLGGLFGGEEGESEDGTGFMAKLGGLFGGEESESEDGTGFMAMLGGLFGGEEGDDDAGLTSLLGGLFSQCCQPNFIQKS